MAHGISHEKSLTVNDPYSLQYMCHRVDAQVSGLPSTDFTTKETRSDGVLTHVWEWR
jgi:hypothetical protein